MKKLIILGLLFAINSCRTQDEKSQLQSSDKTVDVHKTDSLEKKTNQQVINSECCSSLNMDSLRSNFKMSLTTSGRRNFDPSLDALFDDGYENFGFYSLINRSSKLNPPIVATVFVAFKHNSWGFDDRDQIIHGILIHDDLHGFIDLPFNLNDSFDEITTKFETNFSSKNKVIISLENCVILLKGINNSITTCILVNGGYQSDFNSNYLTLLDEW